MILEYSRFLTKVSEFSTEKLEEGDESEKDYDESESEQTEQQILFRHKKHVQLAKFISLFFCLLALLVVSLYFNLYELVVYSF